MDKVKQISKRVTDKILSWNLRKLTSYFIVLAIFVGIGASIFWYKDVYMTNERRFWHAIDNSMATSSVVRSLTTGGTGNQVVQNSRFHFGADTVTESKVEFSTRSATTSTSVVTEGVTTLDSQYSRYTAFDTNDTRPDGSTPDLEGILGIWAGSTVDEQGREQARQSYVSELVTLVIFGNFEADYRRAVINTFKENDTYQIDLKNVQDEVLDGEEVLVLPVSIGLRVYADQLQKSFERAGLGDFPALDPDNYREDSRISSAFIIRKKDNAIIGVEFGDRQEEYTNYGVLKQVEIPTAELTPRELENQVQQQIQG